MNIINKYRLLHAITILAAVIVVTLLTAQARAKAESKSAVMADISVTVAGKSFPSVLYNNAAAKDLLSRLPATFSLSRGSRDYCGDVGTPLTYEKHDVQRGYRNGDIAYWIPGNDFVIFTDLEENSDEVEGCVILGHFQGDLGKL